LNPVPPDAQISASKKNESHDLRLLNTLNRFIRHASQLPTFVELKTIYDKAMYGVGLFGRDKQYGTREVLDMATDQYIYNVNSAFLELKNAISKPDVIQRNIDRYTSEIKLGELHVYNDGQPMKYISSVRV